MKKMYSHLDNYLTFTFTENIVLLTIYLWIVLIPLCAISGTISFANYYDESFPIKSCVGLIIGIMSGILIPIMIVIPLLYLYERYIKKFI